MQLLTDMVTHFIGLHNDKFLVASCGEFCYNRKKIHYNQVHGKKLYLENDALSAAHRNRQNNVIVFFTEAYA
jgi:hypothetical protein